MNLRTVSLLSFIGTFLVFTSIAFAPGDVIESNVPFRIGGDPPSDPKYFLTFNATDLDGGNQTLKIMIYHPETSDLLQAYLMDGYGSLPLDEDYIDLEFEFDDTDMIFLAKDLSVAELNSTILNVMLDYTDPIIPDVEVYIAYAVELPANLQYSEMELKINYDIFPVLDENNLVLLKCGNFDFNSSACLEDWENIPITINSDEKFVSATIDSFSVYTLGEPEEQETCEDHGYSEMCTGDTECEVVQVNSLSCCNCVPIETDNPPPSSPPPSSPPPLLPPPSNPSTSCDESKPSISIDPASQTGMAGETLVYDVNVKNMDSVDCDAREFDLDFELPDGWLVGTDSIGELAPDENKSIEIRVTSPDDAEDDEYEVSVYVFDVDTGEKSDIVYFDYVVESPANEATENSENEESNQVYFSPLTGLASSIMENPIVLIVGGSVVATGVIWKARSMLTRESFYEIKYKKKGKKGKKKKGTILNV